MKPPAMITNGGNSLLKKTHPAFCCSIRILRYVFLPLVFLSVSLYEMNGQAVNLSGTVKNDQGISLTNVNILIKHTSTGTVSDSLGTFHLEVNETFPVTLSFTMVGYQTIEIEVANPAVRLEITLVEQITQLEEIIVHAPLRVEENIMQSPVSIETMTLQEIRNIASDDYYRALAAIKGVEVMQSSIDMQVINSRGFAHPANIRYLSLVDGMDVQIPSLNLAYGNAKGPSMLDVQRIELIPGASSALYGPAAFNGLLSITSKSPFDYQGLSAFFKLGVNHIGSDPSLGEPADPQPMYEAAVRYAKAFKNKFAFKVGFQWMQANDWNANNYSDNNAHLQGDLNINPAYDGINLYGDDGGLNLGWLRNSQDLIDAIASREGLDPEIVAPYVGALPTQNVNRTGYPEYSLVDYNSYHVKVDIGLNYRITDNIELSYAYNYNVGTSVFTSGSRYSINGYNQSHRLGVTSDNWRFLGYTISENANGTYITNFSGYHMNEAYLDGGSWFGTYANVFASGMLEANRSATGSPVYDDEFMNDLFSNSDAMSELHILSRDVSDANRWYPGTDRFKNALDSINEMIIPEGSMVINRTRFFHAEGQYNFKNEIKIFDLTAGGSWRMYDLRSDGTMYWDTEDNPIRIQEYALYLQAFKTLFRDKLKLLLSLRYDKSQNFNGVFSPRASVVYTFLPNHNFRVSYQTGLVNPTVAMQYLDMNIVSTRAIGGIQQFDDRYRLDDWTYTSPSVEAFSESVVNGAPDPSLLVQYTNWTAVKPERVQVIEVGYRGMFARKLFLDVYYYYNIYHDFQNSIRVRQAQDENGEPADPASDDAVLYSLLSGGPDNTFQWVSNNTEIVKSHGAALGVDYYFYKSYRFGINYTWNKLIDEGSQEFFLDQYNTPEHIVNVNLSNMFLTRKLGFAIAWRWQEAFTWDTEFFQDGIVPAFSTLDAQVSYRFPKAKLELRLGGTNILNNRHVTFIAGPTIGSVYYVSLTFDQLMK